MEVREMVLSISNNNPWEGFTWPEILSRYRGVYQAWSRGEDVKPPRDCPIDDLIPAMESSLSPELRTRWKIAHHLYEEDREAEGDRIALEVLEETGLSEVFRMREEMGLTD